jgi:hypothetical protein
MFLPLKNPLLYHVLSVLFFVIIVDFLVMFDHLSYLKNKKLLYILLWYVLSFNKIQTQLIILHI